MGFFEHLQARAVQQNTLLCVGLDPRPERFPPEVAAQEDPIFACNRGVIDATRDLVCAYKPNYAFYEAWGLEGLRALRRTVEYIGPDIPVILDAKRGDIGSTSAALARAAFEVWGAGAVTVAPYLGSDSIAPFTDDADRGVFVLCHTSNPGAAELQTLECQAPVRGAGEPLYLHVARLSRGWSKWDNVGLVVGATYPQALREVRARAPEAWFLVPGIGAQGGDLEATVAAGLRADGLGLVINVSRAVCDAGDPRTAAQQFRDQINGARTHLARTHLARSRLTPTTATPHPEDGDAVKPASEPLISKPTALEDEGLERCKNVPAAPPGFNAPSPRPGGAGAADPVPPATAPSPRPGGAGAADPVPPATAPSPRPGGAGVLDRHTDLILDLARIGAVRFGEFTLKSGATSPIYIDLRLLASYPEVLRGVAAAYTGLLQGLEYDRLAAIPYAALPIGTAVALQTGRPLIYPRKEVKGYGTRQAIEGVYVEGERVVVLDDLITTGESKIEALAPLKDAGLEMQDVVVLIDRESGGRETLAREGLRLHAVLSLGQILDVLVAHGQMAEEQRSRVAKLLFKID